MKIKLVLRMGLIELRVQDAQDLDYFKIPVEDFVLISYYNLQVLLLQAFLQQVV